MQKYDTTNIVICAFSVHCSKYNIICSLVTNIRYKLACANSDDSNQSSHSHSLIKVFSFSPGETLDPLLYIESTYADPERAGGSDPF